MHSAAMMPNGLGLEAYQHSQQLGQKAREQRLLQRYLGLVKRVVKHLLTQTNTVMAKEDMEQVGLMALLEVIRRYPEQADDDFERLAALRIRGAILDELRRLDWRPRRVRQNTHALRDGERYLQSQLGRMPTDGELSEYLRLSVQDITQRRLDTQAEHIASFDVLEMEQETFFGLSFQCQAHEKAKLKQALVAALGKLSEREQMLLALYYQKEMNLKEIALVLSLTEARISQLHKQALQQLQTDLADWREPVSRSTTSCK